MKNKELDLFYDEEGEKYFFMASGGTQTIKLCQETEKNVIFEIDYKNAYKMFDYLEKSIDYLDREEE